MSISNGILRWLQVSWYVLNVVGRLTCVSVPPWALIDLKPSLRQVTSRSEVTGTGTLLYLEISPMIFCESCHSSWIA